MEKKTIYPENIQRIHNEFETAADILLAEAKLIMEKSKEKSLDKIQRMQALGFIQTPEVLEGKKEIEKQNISQDIINRIDEYRVAYPNKKFITTEQVATICKKYNLLMGDVKNYTGFVPEKNLKQIEDFNLKAAHVIQYAVVTKVVYNYQTAKRDKKDFANRLNKNNKFFKSGSLTKYDVYSSLYGKYDNIIDSIEYEWIYNRGLLICAPEKDFKFERKQKKGFKLSEYFKVKYTTDPDPVVLKEVKDGYLILTAWGDEASDELVVNQNNN